ncbi:MAG: orotate phosphoribosyltransferase [Candidatus Tectomicrobia bacterium]|nr:orotate phosphoribosyltransferase [Candidatus Tectomicrobia bacterium]
MNAVGQDWEALRQLLLARSYAKKKVVLASGRESDFYVDCRQTTLHGQGARLVGRLFLDRVRRSGARAVGGPTLGADPMITAISLTAALEGLDLPAFIIRKAAKDHGMGNRIEGMGNLAPGMRVAIVEDVVTTAASTLSAIEAAQEAKLDVVQVLCLVDREEGGRENLAARGFSLDALYTKTTLLSGRPA